MELGYAGEEEYMNKSGIKKGGVSQNVKT